MTTIRFLAVLLVVGVVGFARSAFADLSSELEVHAWRASAQRVGAVERQIVQQLAETPESAYLHYLLVHVQLRNYFQNPFDLRYLFQAIQLGQQALDLQPESVFALLAAIEILEFVGENRELEKTLAHAVASHPTSWRVKFAKLRAHSPQIPNEKLVSEFASIANSGPVAMPVVSSYLVALARTEPHLEKRLDILRNMLIQTDAVDLHLEAATVLSEMNEHHASLHHLQQSATRRLLITPEQSAEVALLTAKANKKLGKLEDARRILDINSSLFSMFPDSEVRSRFLLGSIALEQAKFSTAQDEFEKLIQLDPKIIKLVHDEYVLRGHLREYISLGDQLMTEFGTAERYALQAWTYRQIGLTSSAITNLKNAVELDPQKVQYHQRLGLAHIDQGNFKLAQVSIENAFFLNPANQQTEMLRKCLRAIQDRTTHPSLFGEKKIPSGTACDTISLLLENGDLEP